MPDHLDVFLDDEPEPEWKPAPAPPKEALVITNDDLIDDPLPAKSALPGYAPTPYPTPVPGMAPGYPYPSKGKPSMTQVMGSVLWQTVLAGAVGGLLAWAVLEPFVNDDPGSPDTMAILLAAAVMGCAIGGCVGLCLGAVEGLTSRAWNKALLGGLLGGAIGLGGGFIGGIIAQLVYSLLGGGSQSNILLQIFARAVGWAVIGVFVGLGQGVAIRSKRKILNGLLGGAIGGGIGGLLFDIVSIPFSSGLVSRLIAITVLGACAGAAIGMVEELTKQAWLRIIGGWLAGKEFILYHNATVVGSSPACQITIPKDPSIMPQHFSIQAGQGGYDLVALQPQSPTYVNGRPVQRGRLRDGDRITIGNTIFLFSERAAKMAGPYPPPMPPPSGYPPYGYRK